VVTKQRLIGGVRYIIPEYCEEAHCRLCLDWVKANDASPSGFDITQLVADLKEIE
jgi:hypothetical protein